MPLPVDNLTQEPVEKIGAQQEVSRMVGEYTPEQGTHVSRLTCVKYCSNPELYLTEAGIECIPQDLYEEDEAYQIRLSRSYSSFQPFYTHLRNLVVGTALRKSVQLPDDVAEDWSKLFDNVDLEGNPLQSFVKTLFSNAIDGGCSGIFVEYPKVGDDVVTIADEKASGYRPYFVSIPSQDILGWTSEVTASTLSDETIYGRKLTSLRIRDEERTPDPNDEFGEVVLSAVRVYDFEPGNAKVRYRRYISVKTDGNGGEEYQLNESSFLSVETIPFVPVYGGIREAFMIARPLLLDVARLNLHHWATAADLANQLHLSAVPLLVISGVQGAGAELEIVPNKALFLDKPEAKAEWIGAPMDGAKSVMEHLSNLELSMEKLAAVAMTTHANQAESGFSKLLDRAQSDSLLAILVQGLEASLNLAVSIAAEYVGLPPVKLSLSRDFVPVRLHSQQILSYVELYRSKVISLELLLQILDIGDVFDGIADFDVLEEIKKLGAQPGDSGPTVAKELESLRSPMGNPATSKVEGARPRQAPESGREPKEALRPSPSGA